MALGAFQPLDDIFLEDIGDQTHLPMGNKAFAVGRNNAARFLTAMLERIKPEIDHVGRFRDGHRRPSPRILREICRTLS